jgi:tetratricopeptide (TPR) repeat protein
MPRRPFTLTRRLFTLGNTLYYAGRLDEARELFERGRAIARELDAGKESRLYRSCLTNLAGINALEGLVGLERCREAVEAYDTAERTLSANGATATRRFARVLAGHAVARSELGRLAQARELIDQALEVHASLKLPGWMSSDIRFDQAKIVWRSGERGRALAIARKALEDLKQGPAGPQHDVREMARWIDERTQQAPAGANPAP